MQIKCILIFFLFVFSCHTNNDSTIFSNTQEEDRKDNSIQLTRNEIIEIVLKDFKKISQLHKIKKINSEIVDISDIFVDDFNNDNVLDVIVFSSGFFQEGGNMVVYSFSFFTIENNKLLLKDEVSSSDDIEIINSKDKKVYFKTKRHSDDDPQCCPSLIEKNSVDVNNNLLEFSKKLNRV